MVMVFHNTNKFMKTFSFYFDYSDKQQPTELSEFLSLDQDIAKTRITIYAFKTISTLTVNILSNSYWVHAIV